MPIDIHRLRNAYLTARFALLDQRGQGGYWEGELSSSALSTATGSAALAIVDRSSSTQVHSAVIAGGLRWLAEQQNPDGGWGDTVKSVSNISTTMLCRAAFHICGNLSEYLDVLKRCEYWLHSRYGETMEELAEAVRQRYGKDRTFSVPILTMCALAGLVKWNEVPRLPFELACLPQSWYRFAGLPVVSYALPALIAIGQGIHHHRSTWNPITRFLRWLGRGRTSSVLERIQPSSGGFLEATPLTSFVVMSLASMRSGSPTGNTPVDRVIDKGVEFIVKSARPDGSWPIDTNLSVWVTTLSVNALAAAGDLDCLDRKDELVDWLLAQQNQGRHPYTGADPGGWGWSHLPGSVPDCDDTPGALLALHHLTDEKGKQEHEEVLSGQKPPGDQDSFVFRILLGLTWMNSLQNRDSGWPTFCRGWGKLPFDRSGTDLTAHVLRANQAWSGNVDELLRIGLCPAPRRPKRACELGLVYLARQQRADGSWLPLWFGNQHAPDDINPVYGTARVLAAYRDLGLVNSTEAQRAIDYLLSVQNHDGGWGGGKDTPSSVEETALAVEVLVEMLRGRSVVPLERGIDYLLKRVEDGSFTDPSPIGFYFAKLWYFEKLYPRIFMVAALGRALRNYS
jgi:squalene-hopene/tetraprenyl-beta-curcumene cyclase